MSDEQVVLKMNIANTLPKFTMREELAIKQIEMFDDSKSIQNEIEKRLLAYAYECWKDGRYYIIDRTEYTMDRQEDTAAGIAVRIRVDLCAIKTAEEFDIAIKSGWTIFDFSGWTKEMFYQAGVEVKE